MKRAKSQWDFGELFPPETAGGAETGAGRAESATAAQAPGEEARRVLTVAELTSQVRRLLETQMGEVWVTGEVTNYRAQSSGHLYFTLKDAESQLSCVLFRGEKQIDRALVKDGQKLILRGELTVYELRGQYQLRVTSVELHGVGELQLAFERLKQKLLADGLFAAERKRVLPSYPQRIGLVTSPTGAAIRDVLHVAGRRNPGLQIILAPCRVQGQGAAEEIAAAIQLLNEYNSDVQAAGAADGAPLDLILLTRGGGSLEDLWAFNEEVVARAIFNSALPVISAVGHEIDFTISDFVADFRAATPSAAAEMITEDVYSSVEFIQGAMDRMARLFRRSAESRAWELDQIMGRLARLHPRRRFNEWSQEMDDLREALLRCTRQGARNHRTAWQNLASRLTRVRPRALLKQRREVVEQARGRFLSETKRIFAMTKDKLASLQARLQLLGPEQVLARGYSITLEEKTGKVIRSATEVKPGQGMLTRVKSGEIRSIVTPPDRKGGS